MISDYHHQTAFLKQCLQYDDTAERARLEASITKLQDNERSVRRALRLVMFAGALSLVGLTYTALFFTQFPQTLTGFLTQFAVKVFCALGVGSLICLVAFTALLLIYRRELNQRRAECRRVATRILECRLGKPEEFKRTPPAPTAPDTNNQPTT